MKKKSNTKRNLYSFLAVLFKTDIIIISSITRETVDCCCAHAVTTNIFEREKFFFNIIILDATTIIKYFMCSCINVKKYDGGVCARIMCKHGGAV